MLEYLLLSTKGDTMANIAFKSQQKYNKFLEGKQLSFLNEGSEARCYLSQKDGLVYKNLLDCTKVFTEHDTQDVITKDKINLPSYAFPIDLFTNKQLVWGYTSEFIKNDLFDEKNMATIKGFLKIDLYKLRKALEQLKKDTEILSSQHILLDDIPNNLIFTGTRLVAIDTLSYLKLTDSTHYSNLDLIDEAIKNVFDKWLRNQNIEVPKGIDIDTYLKEVETLQRQLKK